MEYQDINQIIEADGLRLVLVRGMPSPWGQATKAMMEYKGLDFLVGPQQGGGENPELLAWSGVNSAPVVAWNDEPPLNGWLDILLLLERLAPDKSLVPQGPSSRVQLFGLAHEICGELGFGWNRRLDLVHAGMKSGDPPQGVGAVLGKKYGYNEIDGPLAASRAIAFMGYLAETLRAQAERGSDFLIGERVTAVDFYWATFSNLVAMQPQEECPLDPAVRPMFESTSAEVTAAIDPILIEHRDRMMRAYFKVPMEM